MDEWMLNDLLECSVCLERLDSSSRVLPCQHTFCKKCLEEILQSHKELRCPECRILVPVKIEDLPPNVLLMRILEGMKNAPRSKQNDSPTIQQQQSQEQFQLNIQTSPNVSQQPLQPTITIPTETPRIQVTTKNPVSLHQPCAKALYDYEAQEEGDLSFKKGDIILLKKRIDSNWYHGECNSNQGFFPVTYVQILIPLPNSSVPQCVALYDFKMSADDEKDCLTFNKGAVVTVIRRIDENWAEGRLADRIGIFPISFVEMNSAAKHLMKSSMNCQPGPSRSAPALPVTHLQNSLNLTHLVSSPTPTGPESSPTSPVSVTNRVQTREKRLSLNVNQQPQQQQQHRRSAEILNRNRYLASSVDSELQPLVQGLAASPNSLSTGTPLTSTTPPALYIALYPYKPQKADELELRKGALYTVSEKCQDGWFKGTSVRTQKVGVFPGNYVQAVRSQPHHLLCSPPPAQSSTTHGDGSRSSSHPPPKLPPRSLSPSTSTTSNTTSMGQVLKPLVSGTTSSSASVPAAVVARLATTPAPASALSPRTTSLITPPPNVAIGAEATPSPQSKKEKEKSSVSLMKRLTSRKKSSPPLLHPLSIDNPVFEDGYLSPTAKSLAPPNAPVHVRSGSCPSQLLQMPTPERLEREPDKEPERNRHSMGGSQRIRSNRHRPNILPGANLTWVTRPASAVATVDTTIAAAATAAPSAALSREKERKHKQPSPAVQERYRCITPYPPNSEYELELRVGDVVYVHKKRDDGWYKGTLNRTGKSGMFPKSFVEPLN